MNGTPQASASSLTVMSGLACRMAINRETSESWFSLFSLAISFAKAPNERLHCKANDHALLCAPHSRFGVRQRVAREHRSTADPAELWAPVLPSQGPNPAHAPSGWNHGSWEANGKGMTSIYKFGTSKSLWNLTDPWSHRKLWDRINVSQVAVVCQHWKASFPSISIHISHSLTDQRPCLEQALLVLEKPPCRTSQATAIYGHLFKVDGVTTTVWGFCLWWTVAKREANRQNILESKSWNVMKCWKVLPIQQNIIAQRNTWKCDSACHELRGDHWSMGVVLKDMGFLWVFFRTAL